MFLGIVPDHLPIAPRPVPGELRSSWLRRVAASNGLSLGELIAAAATRHPDAELEQAFLDADLAPAARTALAHFTRLDGAAVDALDVSEQFPALPRSWMLRTWSNDARAVRHAHTAFCAHCLAATNDPPPHLPAEWACACVSYCVPHRTRLLERCPACFVDEPFAVGWERPNRAECWHCGANLAVFPPALSDRFDEARVIALQQRVVAALRGASSPAPVAGLRGRDLVTLTDELIHLLIEADSDEPAFIRVATVHWPAERGLLRAHHSPTSLADLPVAWRFVVMAIIAAIVLIPPLRTSTRRHRTDPSLSEPLRTLANTLRPEEWHRWETHMASWPDRIRTRLRVARQVRTTVSLDARRRPHSPLD